MIIEDPNIHFPSWIEGKWECIAMSTSGNLTIKRLSPHKLDIRMRSDEYQRRYRLKCVFADSQYLEFRMIELNSRIQNFNRQDFLRIQFDHLHKMILTYREHTVPCRKVRKK
jgi:hypothetical protein